MSEPERLVPRDRAQLQTSIDQLFEGRKHVKSVTVDGAGYIIIDLDGMANTFGHPDMKLPIKRGKIAEAEGIVGELRQAFNGGHAPTAGQVNRLWDLVDPSH